MATLNDELRDLTLKHSVGVQRLGSGVVKKLIPLLDKSDDEVVQKLLSRGPTLEGAFTSQRLQFLLKALRDINHDAHVKIGQELRQELRDLAKYEADFQQRMLNGNTVAAVDFVSPSAAMLTAVVNSKPFGGTLLKDAVKGLETGRMRLLKEAVQLGMIQGETSDQIVRRVRGTKALNFRDGILDRPRVALERMVRTAVNHVANASREEFYKENDDLISEVQWVATLDTRTCPRCGALDGETFKMDDGPRPPLHLNCRCATVPVVKSWKEMGIDIEELPPGTRASMNGQVSETETYQTWLKKQSADVQDEALGKTRGELFRKGSLSVDRFTDVAGNQLTLDQLRLRERQSFEDAGLTAPRPTPVQPTGAKASASDLYTPAEKTADELVDDFGAASAIEDVRAKLAKATSTNALATEGGFTNADGTYTAARAALHEKILDEIFSIENIAKALPAEGTAPTLTMLGGRGGSGKSWLTGKDGPVDASSSILLDSDDIKSRLPGYAGWNAALYHEESGHILNLADKRAIRAGVNTIHDATMKSDALVSARMELYKNKNYRVDGYYMYLSPEAATERALARFSKGGTFKGRFVPPEVVLQNTQNEKNFDKLSSKFTKWAIYDNSGSKAKGPRLVEEGGRD